MKRIVVLLLALIALSGCSTVVTGDSWANLSTDGKFVYVAYKDQIFKVDPTANPALPQERRPIPWLKKLPNGPTFYAAPAISDDGQLFVGSYSTRGLYSLRSENGNVWEGWRVPTYTDKVVGRATINGDMVYVGMGDKGVRAYNRKTGQEFKFDDTKFGIWAQPLIIKDVVYVPSLDHTLYALKADTLQKLWSLDLGGGLSDAPAYNGVNTLYIGTWNSEVLAIDISGSEGKVSARFAAKNWVWSTPVYDEGSLYFGDLIGNVYGLDAKTMQQKWMIAPEADALGGVRGRIGIAKNVPLVRPVNGKIETNVTPTMLVYGTEGKRVYAVDTAGQRLWVSALTMSDKILSDIVIIGNSAVFTTQSDDQLVVALNLSSGQKDWQVRLSEAQLSFQPTAQPQ